MGVFSRINRKATWHSVVRRAVVSGLLCTGLYIANLWWNDWWDDLPLKVGICAALSMFIGGLWEWQVPDDFDMDIADGDCNAAADTK